ncbi:MAG: hypothetical protein R3E31_13875 [Chloroflexota bacterium]
MISMLDAIPLANDYVAAKYLDYGLVLASRVPVRLPTGWRFPYDSFAGSFRVRHSMLILFVADDGTISEEWNDFLTEPHQDALHTLYNELAATPLPICLLCKPSCRELWKVTLVPIWNLSRRYGPSMKRAILICIGAWG